MAKVYKVQLVKSKTNKKQPYHARMLARNGRILWHTETLVNKSYASRMALSQAEVQNCKYEEIGFE